MVILAIVLAAVAPYVPIYQAMPSRAAIKVYSFATGSVRSRDYGETTYVAKFIMPNRLSGQRTWLQIEDARQRDLSFITYDPMAKQWAMTGIEWPVSYGVATGSMSGNRLVVTGNATVFGRPYFLRTTYTKKTNDAFTLLNEERMPDGKWMPDDEYDFVRVKR